MMTEQFQIEDYVDRNYDPAEQEEQNVHKPPRGLFGNTLAIGKTQVGKSKLSIFIYEMTEGRNVE